MRDACVYMLDRLCNRAFEFTALEKIYAVVLNSRISLEMREREKKID
jgi:hypothetical protein